MTTQCAHCGAPLPAGTHFCPNCGQPVAAAVPPDQAQAPPPVAPQYGAPPPQPPYGQASPPLSTVLQNLPALAQRLQNLPFLAALPVGLRLPALAVAAILVLALLNKMAHPGGASAPGQPGGNSPTAQAGVFQGRCTTEAGAPLANVDVKIVGLTSAGENTSVEAHTNADGVYSTTLPAGKYAVANAYYTVTFAQVTYQLPLALTDGENNDGADIGPGIVCNMVLHIHGPVAPGRPDNASAFYGGSISAQMYGRYELAPDNSITEVTFTPEGPLLDGTTGQTIVRQYVHSPGNTGATAYFYDIPIGRYTITARLLNPDGSLLEPLTIDGLGGGTDPSAYKPSFDAVFPPEEAMGSQIGDAGGVKLLELAVNDGG